MAGARFPKGLTTRDASRPLSIRPRMSTGYQLLFGAVVIAVAAGCLYGAYLLGSRVAGQAGDIDGQAALELQARVSTLQAEVHKLRLASATSESRLQVEKTAQGQLALQLKAVESENSRLKEEIAFFENLVASGRAEPLSIQNLRVEPGAAIGEYRYRMFIVSGDARQGQEFRGHIQLLVNVQRGEGTSVLTIPDPKMPADSSHRLAFRRMQRVDGVFRVEAGAVVRSVQVRVMEQGAAQPRATRNLTLS